MGKIQILHVIGGGEIGGAEELVLALMHLLDKDKYEPHLVCLCPGPFVQVAQEQEFKASTILMRHRLDVSTIAPLQEYIRTNRINIVHTHGVRANLVARIAAKKEKLPVVTTVHSVLRYDYDTWYKAAFARCITMMTNHHTDKFIAISRAIADEIKTMQVPDEKIAIIHNGLDTSKFTQPRDPDEMKKELGIEPGLPVVTMIARLHPVKGHEYFLQAARKIVDTGLKAEFLIVGEGFERPKLEKKVRELGLQNKVKMPGYYSPVEDIYALSDLVCVPSLMEGLGMVILEAMYFNVPVVASEVGGIPEIVEHRVNGLLVKPRDYQTLANEIMNVLIDSDLARFLCKNGQATVNNFTRQKMACQVENIYEELIAK
ncbi:MAG: glycosyltransferase family 4 protein [Syntrophomonadaceae bacterium]|nr:glycosyltransferase family 4 protein [Syntrophomonadaceae bacterium]MDD4548907.1 glycosyltransferase family 4 protein [Syntrophomonadaceae bacterium]